MSSTLLHFDDDRINEASGLGYSRSTADLIYVNNDEDGPIYSVRASTAKTLGTFRINGVTLEDPESLSVDFNGDLWVADIGDNAATRDWVNVYRRGEPGAGNKGSLNFTHYRLKYPGGARNAEAFLTSPSGERFIIDKDPSSCTVFKLPKTLKTSPSFNTLTSVATGLPDEISDATFSKDGLWVFALRKFHNDSVSVFSSDDWVEHAHIDLDHTMDKPEGITVAPNGKTLLVCDDNSRNPNAKLQINIPIPGNYQPAGSSTPGAPPPPPKPANPCA